MNRFDIIVFGATGFTGKFVVKNLLSVTKKPEYNEITWALSGRCREKLDNLLEEFKEFGTDTSRIQTIECDVTNEDALRRMSSKARVVINCVGPYTLLGEPVVKACIQTGTHYVDVTAELHFVLEMYQKYHKAAEEVNVLIITACGFASIPGVMGFTQIQKDFRGVLQTVECYTELHVPRRTYIPGPNKCLVHYGTWASFVYEIQNYKEYVRSKAQTFPEPLNTEHSSIKKSFFHRSKGRFWLPYPGPDKDIAEMTERYLQKTKTKKPIHFRSYVTMPLFIHFLIIVPAFFLVYILSYFKCFIKLLWKHPKLFSLGYISRKGPSQEIMEETKYSFTLIGQGWDQDVDDLNIPFNKSMTLKVSGSNPGYGCTAVASLMSAITILKDISRMPSGGVVSSGAAFWDTSLVDRLQRHGITFERIDDTFNC